MGRMLEALKNKDVSRLNVRDKPFLDDAVEHLAGAETPTSAEDSIPFVEVGGPNKKVEGSAQVMAVKHLPQSLAQPHVQPPHHAPHQPAEKMRPPVPAEPSPTRAMGVAFEPWPSLPQLGHGIAAEIVAFHHPEHAVSRQYAGLMAKMRDGLEADDARVVLFTGSRPQAGTSIVLLNLAVAAAQQGKGRVVVVDAHVSRPSLAQRLGYACAAGLQEVLQGKLALEQAVVQTTISGLYLVPAQASGDHRPLKIEAVQWLFTWLSDHFDLVLVDGPSLDANNQLAVLTSACDGAYMVLPEGESQQTQRALAQTMTASGARMRGLFHTQGHH